MDLYHPYTRAAIIGVSEPSVGLARLTGIVIDEINSFAASASYRRIRLDLRITIKGLHELAQRSVRYVG